MCYTRPPSSLSCSEFRASILRENVRGNVMRNVRPRNVKPRSWLVYDRYRNEREKGGGEGSFRLEEAEALALAWPNAQLAVTSLPS